MNLVLPCEKYKAQYYELVDSAIKNKDVSEMGNAYRNGENYQDMLKNDVSEQFFIKFDKLFAFVYTPGITYFNEID